jgi:hypothetical protein
LKTIFVIAVVLVIRKTGTAHGGLEERELRERMFRARMVKKGQK